MSTARPFTRVVASGYQASESRLPPIGLMEMRQHQSCAADSTYCIRCQYQKCKKAQHSDTELREGYRASCMCHRCTEEKRHVKPEQIDPSKLRINQISAIPGLPELEGQRILFEIECAESVEQNFTTPVSCF